MKNNGPFPGYDPAFGPRDPADLQHRHPWQQQPQPKPETVPSTESKAPDATMTRISTTAVRRRQPNEEQTNDRTKKRTRTAIVEKTVDGTYVTTRTKSRD